MRHRGAFLFLAVLALAATGTAVWAETQTSEVFKPDLGVTYIQRRPMYNAYRVEYRSHDRSGYISGYYPDCGPGCIEPRLVPGTEGDKRWPDPGEPVTFTAHVRNHGLAASPPTSYTWTLDAARVGAGSLPGLAPGEEVSTNLTLLWPHGLSADGQRVLGEHTIAFSADPEDAIAETTELNNTRQDRTDALALAVWVSQAAYDLFQQYANPDGETYAFEDWEQWHVAQFNRLFAEAGWPLTPEGVSERIRLDTIHICPADQDCSPAEERGRHDGGWGHPTPETWYVQEVLAPGRPDWALLHEWGHQLGLIDLYMIAFSPPFNHIPDRSGDPWLVATHTRQWDSLMSNVTPLLDEHTAYALNRDKGRRRGYYGEYLLDLPAETRLRVLDAAGQPVSGAAVQVCQATYDYQYMDQDLRFHGLTGADGQFSLGAAPFGPVSIIGNNSILFITLSARGQEEHFWLDITELNLAFWQGQTGVAVWDLATHIPPAGVTVPAPPAAVQVKTVGPVNTLTWEGQAGLTYNIYRGRHPGFAWQRVVIGTAGTSFGEDISPYLEWTGAVRYALSAVDGAGHESAFAVAHGAALERPEGIGLGPDGRRWIVDNHYGEAFLQRPDGEILGVTTFSDEGSSGRHDVAVDPQGYAYLQAADSGSVRLFDPAGHTLGALTTGLTGTYGLAYLGEGYAAATDVAVLPVLDDRTGLLAYFESSVNGEDDKVGISSGVSFTGGVHGQGVLLAGDASLAYPTAGNLQAGQGAVEMWLRPNWDGDDGGNYTLFWWGDGGQFFHLRKDPISNLVFDYFYAEGSCGAPAHVAAWRAGEWHHVAFTWQGREISLYVDGQRQGRAACGGVAQPDGDLFYIGSNGDDGQAAMNAVVDDLRLSSVARLARSDRSYLFLAGGGRLRVVDALGRELGGLSHTAFVDLRGLAVSAAGRLYLADAGANAIHIVQFAPQTESLAYVGSLGEGQLQAPNDVTVDGAGRLVVADSGHARLALWDEQGNLLGTRTLPDPPYNDAPLANPRAVAWAGDGLVVSDGEGWDARVVYFRAAGWFRAYLPYTQTSPDLRGLGDLGGLTRYSVAIGKLERESNRHR
jgi:hypothetical protein